MDELVTKIGSDSTFMFLAAMALVILLVIVLVVVVSSMRIKTYKDRYINTKIDNQEKEKLIVSLQEELQVLKIKNAQNEQELHQFAQTKEKLEETEKNLNRVQLSGNELEKLQSKTKAKLDNVENMYASLLQDHKTFQERFDTLQEENSKLRINNARLLMKVETEERFAAQAKQKESKKKS